jgi:polyisoprenoid-binding protein YceI
MKKITYAISALTLTLFFAACGGGATENEATTEETTEMEATEEAGPSGTYVLSPEESQLAWAGSMLKIGGVSLYGHNGTINFEKGKMSLENGTITGGTIIVDMSTITPLDDGYSEENPKENLIGHLSSPDFFAVDSFPTATYVITGMEGDKIMGDMTIRGITHNETIEGVTMETMEGKVKATGKMVLDRQKYNVSWSNPAEDKVLSDDLDLEFTVVASADEAM